MIAYLFVFAVIFAIAFYAYPNIRKKLIIYYHALLFWWYCQELVETPPPKKTYPHTRMQSKTVLFIRHGESEWNSIVNEFNIADIMWWYRLVRIGVFEMVYFITRPNSSKLIDSPLNQKGLQQAIAASEPFNAYFSSQGFSKRRCCFISSQLRRAIETAAYVCDSHLSTSNPLRVRSELQELSPNIDAYSLLDNKKGAPCTELTFTRVSCQKVLDIGDFEGNAGNKRASELGEVRIDRFATWLAMDPHHDVYIVVGHSLWMKRFFNRYVPTTDCGQVRYCNEKIKNCGIVAFEFAMNSENKPLVVPSTIVAVN